MRTKYAVTLIAMGLITMVPAKVFAEGGKGYELDAKAQVGGRVVSGEHQSAKFNEYKSIKTGAFGNVSASYFESGKYINFTGTDVGHDDQYLKLSGGKYGKYKYKFYFNQTPHNYSFHAKSLWGTAPFTDILWYRVPYDRPKNTDAFFTPNAPAIEDQAEFDYKIRHDEFGGVIDYTGYDPITISISASSKATNGTLPMGASTGVDIDHKIKALATASQGPVELPMPVKYQTNDVGLGLSYAHDNIFASVDSGLSNFRSKYKYLTWRQPFVTTQSLSEVSSITPDDLQKRLAFKVAISDLPMSSQLTLKADTTKYTNSVPLLDSSPWDVQFFTAGTTSPAYGDFKLLLNENTFKGDIRYSGGAIALTSKPLDDLDTKIYANYYKKSNKSNTITYATLDDRVRETNELFEYSKSFIGADLTYRLPEHLKTLGGYEWAQIHRRGRENGVATYDHKVYAKIKNNSLEWLTGWVQADVLFRKSDFNVKSPAYYLPGQEWRLGSNFEKYMRYFDVTDKTQKGLKGGFDIEATEDLNFAIDGGYKKGRYHKSMYGKTDDSILEGEISSQYNVGDMVKLGAHFGAEKTHDTSKHRTAGIADPWMVDTQASYHWIEKVTDYTYIYGGSAEVPKIMENLSGVASYEKLKGHTAQNIDVDPGKVSVARPELINMPNMYHTSKDTFDLKFNFEAMKELTLTLGGMYEVYHFGGNQWDNYVKNFNIPNSTATSAPSAIFLTGAYADNDYKVVVGYISATYRF